jgi:hypothetical protein
MTTTLAPEDYLPLLIPPTEISMAPRFLAIIVVMKLSNPFSPVPQWSREAASIHQAGHAAAHHRYGLFIQFIEIHREGNGQWRGRTQPLTQASDEWEGDDVDPIPVRNQFTRLYEERMNEHIFAAVAGVAAEEYVTGYWNEVGFSGDEKKAFNYASLMGFISSEPVDKQIVAARVWVGTPAAQTRIKTLAATLMEATVISGQIATRIMDEALMSTHR